MQPSRDLSATASGSPGFQFEFRCACCDKAWVSPLRTYRLGQLSRMAYRMTGLFFSTTNVALRGAAYASDLRYTQARENARKAAIEQARAQFHDCAGCGRTVCNGCFDAGTRQCRSCRGGAAGDAGSAAGRGAPSADAAAAAAGAALRPRCPSCQAASDGGRFCPGCGFDLASTHKSCPGCGNLLPRAARFCGDCGHGF